MTSESVLHFLLEPRLIRCLVVDPSRRRDEIGMARRLSKSEKLHYKRGDFRDVSFVGKQEKSSPIISRWEVERGEKGQLEGTKESRVRQD